MNNSKYCAWAEQQDAAGIKDAMGWSFISWLIAIYQPDGQPAINAKGHMIYETQNKFKAGRIAPDSGKNLELFS